MGRPQAHLRIALLGPFALEAPGGALVGQLGRKTRALLACLALAPGKIWPREKLMALLWSDRGDDQARASLRQALAELRRSLGDPSPLRTDNETVSLDPALVSTDAPAFEDLVKAERFADAVALYRGPLLDGHGVRDEAFDDWLRIERARLHELAIQAFQGQAEQQAGEAAINSARQLLQLEPAREETHRLLMRLHAAAGQRAEAMRQYRQCRDVLQRELQAEPDAETERLHIRIQDGNIPTDAIAIGGCSGPLHDRPSIAVLRFANLSSDLEQDYFADGLAEDLITDLSRIGGLLVIARHSSFAYKDRTIDARQAARELGVAYIVEGSVRRSASRIRIAIQLMETARGGYLWADRFDRDLEDVFAVQGEVASKIVAALADVLPSARVPPKRRAPSIEAYDLFVRGRVLTVQSPHTTRAALPLLEKTIALDPDFAEAHAWLAMNLTFQWIDGRDYERERVLAAADRAVSLDPGNADAYFMRGYALAYSGNLAAGLEQFELALKSNPNHADAWLFLTDLKVFDGRPQEAIRAVEKAFELNPHPHATYHWLRGFAFYAARHYEEAVRALDHEECRGNGSQRILAAALAQLGRLEEARDVARQFMNDYPEFTMGGWARTQPFRAPGDLDHFIAGYAKAGLPE
jgi:TolB-like protein/DNA-binding SARP family transcriptional activator/cytochrome c-type biogenesis protein CcmH/NrfG